MLSYRFGSFNDFDWFYLQTQTDIILATTADATYI